ncbi:MAG TPA: hypothetical protein VME46_17005 [Acidimicrobiales bacterium]|nr:hypothetical protein [Acidimicrobiales bacterium]
MQIEFNDARLAQLRHEETFPSRRVKELLSWRLVSEVLGHQGGRWRVIEAHNGGGMYDELELVPRYVDHSGFVISFNRAGSAHFPDPRKRWGSIWVDALAAEDLHPIVAELERRAEIASNGSLPTTADLVTVRVISELLWLSALEPERFECRNGYAYGSNGGAVRREWFAAFPGCLQRLAQREPDDYRGEPAFRFWFVLRDDEPVLAFEDLGRAWSLDGKTINLFRSFRRNVSVRPAVARLWRHLFAGQEDL